VHCILDSGSDVLLLLGQVGDVILKVSGAPLSGLSLRQALDILRSSPPVTTLQVKGAAILFYRELVFEMQIYFNIKMLRFIQCCGSGEKKKAHPGSGSPTLIKIQF
jgi:hypothetical protein